MKKWMVCAIFFVLNIVLHGQTILKGKVIEESGEPLYGATVVLIEKGETKEGTISNAKGEFNLSTPIVGQATLRFSYLGYADQDLQINTSNPIRDLQNLQIKMESVETSINTVDVEVGRYNDQEFLPDLAESITIDEVRKLPATFFDPARLAQSFAGVANNNDQANGISIRGNSPDHFKWFLEGVEILNPNHTSNAGTFTDRPSQNAGGVNVLSAQLLSRSQFYKSIYPSNFQNAVGGIMGMSLRNGDQKERKHLVQVGLIGLEVSSEGPIKKDADAGSYLFNYRFSTVGLLTQLGLDFGGEAIDFQDLAFNFSFPIKNGVLKVFGVGGLSNNVFTAPDDEDREEEKDNTNIDFSGDTGIVGFNFDTYLGAKHRLNVTSILSANDATRLSTQALSPSTIVSSDIDQATMWSSKASLEKKIRQGTWTNGVYFTTQSYDVGSNGEASIFIPFTEGNINRGGVFSELEWNWNSLWQLKAGLNAGLEQTTGRADTDVLVEPRINLSRRIGDDQRVHLASGLYSQSRSPRDIIILDGSSIGNVKTWQNSISYIFQKPTYNLKVETFYQRLFDMSLEVFNSFPELELVEGQNYGIESSYRYNAPSAGWTIWLNATLYQSQFQNEEGDWASTRYDGRYIFNTLLGKEWTNSEQKTHGVHIRFNWLGGFRETPIDGVASAAAGTTVFDNSQLFSEQQEDYYRVDLSIYRKVVRKKLRSTISLDIQNLTNRENESFAFYDTFLMEEIRRTQLGLLPILNYRLQF